MRTRRSPRNQEILWRALAGAPTPAPHAEPAICSNCVNYPVGSGFTGACTLNGEMVNGLKYREYFIRRKT